MVIMENASKKRRREESQTSNVSSMTQITTLSSDSNVFSDTNLSPNSIGNDINNQPYTTGSQRQRTISEQRQFEFYIDSQGNRVNFILDENQTMPGKGFPRRTRRNTENSVNTQVKQMYSSKPRPEFHKSRTTSCINDQTLPQLIPQSPTQFQGQQLFEGQNRIPYDNRLRQAPPLARPLAPADRSRSTGTIEHLYVSLDNWPDSYMRPVDTEVIRQNDGATTRLLRNTPVENRRVSNDLLDNHSNDVSSGYRMATEAKQNSFCCCKGDSVQSSEMKFYKTGFKIMFVLNVLVIIICAVGLPIAYHWASDRSQEPHTDQPIGCFDEKDAPLLEGRTQALMQKDLSGKYCPNYRQLIQEVANLNMAVTMTPATERCRPGMELHGKWVQKDKKLSWATRRLGCGLKLAEENSVVEINEAGTYFIYSTILFKTEGPIEGQEFAMRHNLIKNNELLEYVQQHCRANNASVQHFTFLQTLEYLNGGDRINLEVEFKTQTYLQATNHKLGLFKVS